MNAVARVSAKESSGAGSAVGSAGAGVGDDSAVVSGCPADAGSTGGWATTVATGSGASVAATIGSAVGRAGAG